MVCNSSAQVRLVMPATDSLVDMHQLSVYSPLSLRFVNAPELLITAGCSVTVEGMDEEVSYTATMSYATSTNHTVCFIDKRLQNSKKVMQSTECSWYSILYPKFRFQELVQSHQKSQPLYSASESVRQWRERKRMVCVCLTCACVCEAMALYMLIVIYVHRQWTLLTPF